jgi:hypothetical protein
MEGSAKIPENQRKSTKTKTPIFAFFYFFESGLFNGLRPIQMLFFLPSSCLASTPPNSHAIALSHQYSAISDFVKINHDRSVFQAGHFAKAPPCSILFDATVAGESAFCAL